jgi:predicted dehydrogenase
MATDQVRLGIIGLGAEGGMYATFLSEGKVPNMTIGAIADIDESKRAAAEKLGVPFYTDYQELINSGDVDAVVTTVPHYLHPEMGIYALEHGIHTLVEKPVGVYTKQARELIDVAAQHPELTFGVFFNQRTNPLYKDLKALLDSGELGALRHTSWIITTGGVRSPTTPSPPGAPRGAARAAASWSTRPPTSSTCGSGCAASRSRCSRSWPSGSSATSSSRTRSTRSSTSATARPAPS